MNYSIIDKVYDYVNQNIITYHDNKLNKLKKLKFESVLKRKNPYLYKAKNILTAQDLIQTIMDAYLSSQEETLFGTFLEGLAIFVCEQVYNGRKSSAEGIDLEFDNKDIRYLVSIKSGPHWGNSSQIHKMVDNFKKATRIIRSNSAIKNITAINGCCYGKEYSDKGNYIKICGQKFWEFISGYPDFYQDIIEPIGYNAKKHNQLFQQEYARMINLFTLEFSKKYCIDGIINWNALVEFNSGNINK